MPRTIKSEFSNMYGNGKNLNIGKNKSVKELLNQIPNVNLNNENKNERTMNEYKNVNNLEQKETLHIPSIQSIQSIPKNPFKIIYIIILLFIIFLIGIIYFYKDMIIFYFNTIFNEKSIDKSEKDTSAKVDSTSAKIDKLEEKIDKLADKECSQPGVKKLNNKLAEVSSYSKEQNVKENGFCYVGYDNGQRECVDVYAGDICMSGEIFPSLDICINPRLRP